MPDPNAPTLSELRKADLCRLLDLSDTTIANYCKLGMPTTNGGKGHAARFSLPECIKWIQAHEVSKAVKAERKNKPSASDDTAELEARMLAAKVEREEYKTAQLVGSLVTIAEAEATISREMERVRAKMLSIPAVWGPQIIGLNTIPDAVDLLNDLVHNAMQELATETDGTEDEIALDDAEEEPDTTTNEPDTDEE